MDVKITEKKNNELLERIEVTASIEGSQATPSNKDVSKAIADHLKSTEDLVVMRKISTKFGSASATATAYVYKSKEQKELCTPKPPKLPGAGKPAAEAKPEAKK